MYIYVELTFHYARYIAFLTTCHPQTLLTRNERNADCISLVLQRRRTATVRTTRLLVSVDVCGLFPCSVRMRRGLRTGKQPFINHPFFKGLYNRKIPVIVISNCKSNTDYRKIPEEAGPFDRGLSHLKDCTPYPWSLSSTIRISNTLIRAYPGRSIIRLYVC